MAPAAASRAGAPAAPDGYADALADSEYEARSYFLTTNLHATRAGVVAIRLCTQPRTPVTDPADKRRVNRARRRARAHAEVAESCRGAAMCQSEAAKRLRVMAASRHIRADDRVMVLQDAERLSEISRQTARIAGHARMRTEQVHGELERHLAPVLAEERAPGGAAAGRRAARRGPE